jgi:hypothetical protein
MREYYKQLLAAASTVVGANACSHRTAARHAAAAQPQDSTSEGIAAARKVVTLSDINAAAVSRSSVSASACSRRQQPDTQRVLAGIAA